MRRVLVFIAMAFTAIFVASINTIAEEPEYENPEIQLKFNLKEENDALSPQTKLPSEAQATRSVSADVTYDIPGVGKVGRDPVNVGTWISNPVEFDLTININSFDIWWEDTEEEDGDDSCEWTITIEINGEDVSEDTSGCQHDGSELAKGSHSLPEIAWNLVAGDTIGINLVFEGWDDIKIHYDNVTYDTGLGITGSHLYLFDGIWKGSMVSIEFAEAWPTDWETNLDGGYVMVMGDDGYMVDNDKASVRDGNEYTFPGNNSTIEVTSTVIEWTEITGTGIKIMMDYTTFDHMGMGNTSGNGSVKQPVVTLKLQKVQGLLGNDGGILGLPGFEMILTVGVIGAISLLRKRN